LRPPTRTTLFPYTTLFRSVQRLVNRHQPYEVTKSITDIARELGYTSVNYDLIYGLPRQIPEGFAKTVEKTIELRPDRIALYSFRSEEHTSELQSRENLVCR